MGGFIRSSWDEVNEIIAAANVYTVKQYGPDRVIGFSPIPAMSMVSYAAGSRYLSLIGGVCLSFYDWYCDRRRPRRRSGASRPTCRNRPTGTTPTTSSHGAPTSRRPVRRTLTSSPRSATRHQDCRHHPGLRRSRQAHRPLAQSEAGHRRRAGQAFAHVIFKEFHGEAERVLPRLRQALHRPAGAGAPEREGRQLHRRPLPARLRPADNLGGRTIEWKTIAVDGSTGELVSPLGSIGYRWGEKGKWNIEAREGKDGRDVDLS